MMIEEDVNDERYRRRHVDNPTDLSSVPPIVPPPSSVTPSTTNSSSASSSFVNDNNNDSSTIRPRVSMSPFPSSLTSFSDEAPSRKETDDNEDKEIKEELRSVPDDDDDSNTKNESFWIIGLLLGGIQRKKRWIHFCIVLGFFLLACCSFRSSLLTTVVWNPILMIVSSNAYFIVPRQRQLLFSTNEFTYPDHIIIVPNSNNHDGNDGGSTSWYDRSKTHQTESKNTDTIISGSQNHDRPMTLRDVLIHQNGFHLAFAPSFFGYYGYFGALDAWEDVLHNHSYSSSLAKPTCHNNILTNNDDDHRVSNQQSNKDDATKNATLLSCQVRSVAGASAGAMAATLLAAGISPKVAAAFVSNKGLSDFADFPGILAFFRGNKFEQLMYQFLKQHQHRRPTSSVHDDDDDDAILLENAMIPVAVTGFDIQTMQQYIMQRGSMARAARASATVPFLFQPVGWVDENNNSMPPGKQSQRRHTQKQEYVLVDGGITDATGMAGLNATIRRLHGDGNSKNTIGSDVPVINLCVGAFGVTSQPLGPSSLPGRPMVLSISIQNLPQPGPWAMSKGPKATEAARAAMLASLDVPLFPRMEENHYELHIDASSFWK